MGTPAAESLNSGKYIEEAKKLITEGTLDEAVTKLGNQVTILVELYVRYKHALEVIAGEHYESADYAREQAKRALWGEE